MITSNLFVQLLCAQ